MRSDVGHAKKVMITTSDFSREAHEYVKNIEKRIVLIDGDQLAQLMIDHGIGVSEGARYVVKKIDGDYFGGEVQLPETRGAASLDGDPRLNV